MPAISIIVPIYNVEQYLHKCIDSILVQTFTNFELILVNDGSPDNCREICEEYAKKDKRVKVVHKENGGLSDARNTGIDIAEGDYIGFVDSDDWIEPDMYELLYEMCKKNNCEIASCTYSIHYKNTMIVKSAYPLIVQDKNQAMRSMLEDKLYNEVVWTKLIKRSLLNKLRFTVGIIHEDTAFTYKVIHESQQICCIGAPKYNYIKRDNSITDIAKKNVRIDSVLIYDDMYKFINKYYPELSNLVALKLVNCAMLVLNLISSNKNFSKYKVEYYKVTKLLNNYFDKTIRLQHYPISVKVLLIATRIHPLFYKWIINLLSTRRGG